MYSTVLLGNLMIRGQLFEENFVSYYGSFLLTQGKLINRRKVIMSVSVLHTCLEGHVACGRGRDWVLPKPSS